MWHCSPRAVPRGPFSTHETRVIAPVPARSFDLVFGDREGVYFIPPSLVQAILDRADETHIHDEWTKRKFDEGKYKSQEIYGSPRDPALKKEYEEYLARKLAELKAQRARTP